MSSTRSARMLNVTNVISYCLENPEALIEELAELLDSPDYDIPSSAMTANDIITCQQLQAHYASSYAYLVTLYGIIRFSKARNTKAADKAIYTAAVDVFEMAISAAKLKYAASSRLLAGYEKLNDITGR